MSDFDSMLDRYIAPGIIGPRLQTSVDHSSHANVERSSSDPMALINALTTRVRELEKRLPLRGEVDLALPPRVASADPKQMVKSRFYGESHWMNSVDPVGVFHFCKRMFLSNVLDISTKP
jgi:hypothetical protein